METNISQEHFVAPVMQRINALYEQERDSGQNKPATQRSLMRLLRNWLPARLQDAIAQAVPMGLRDWVVSQATSGGYDWERTPALPLLADYNGYVRLNLKGREALGCLQEGDPAYRRYRQWVEAGFRGLLTGYNHVPLVGDLVQAAEVFPGARSEYLPDLIVTWTDQPPAHTLESEVLGRFSANLDTGRSGNHRHEGFMIVHGPGQENVKWQSVNHIADLAPVVMGSYLDNHRKGV
jgi:predicted AlkP superfamily phosphohydrolase/phosphomutase